MLKKKLRDKFIGFGFALAVGLTSAGFAVLGSSPIEANADYADQDISTLRGSVWRIEGFPTTEGFPAVTYTVDNAPCLVVYCDVNCYRSDGRGNIFKGLKYNINSASWYAFTNITDNNVLFTSSTSWYLSFPSGLIYSPADAPVANVDTKMVAWLSSVGTAVQYPNAGRETVDIGDIGAVTFFDLEKLRSLYTYKGFVHITDDLSSHDQLVTFPKNSGCSYLCYSVGFEPYRNVNTGAIEGFNTKYVDFVIVEGWACEFYTYIDCPLMWEINSAGDAMWLYNHTLTLVTSHTEYGVRKERGFVLYDTFQFSSSLTEFSFYQEEIIGFFGSRIGLTHDQYYWLQRNQYMFDDLLNAGYRYIILYKSNGVYQDGYTVGYQNGNDEGRAVGYNEGYNAGVNSVTSGSMAVVSLFGGIASVPINILNGLSEFTIWNVPIINILVTFLFIGLIAFVIRKLVV